GSLPRYAYSKAMKNAGFVWDDNYLRDWIHDNEKFLPGTRMRHVSITDITEQDYLLAFIKTLK
ncbi:MAG: cytochrome C, partial [Rhodospirillaceae bacterium]|nr:cytochrome C [Rhodospirillaceae bacterium]